MSGRRVEPSSPILQVNVSQRVILSKLVTYLRARGRDADFIDNLPAGYCSGFATLAAYGQWLEWQPKRIDEKTHQPIPRDDWTWFHSVLTILARWDGQSELPSLVQQDIERLLSLVEYFQNIDDYLPIAQGDWHESLTDTQKRQPTKEYSVTGLFTAENLLAVLPDLLQEDRMILIGSHNHDVSLLKHVGEYYFYNPNSSSGVHVYPARDVSDVSFLVKQLFSAMHFDQRTPSPLGFRVFNFGEQAATYLPHEALLQQVKGHQPSPGYADNTTALHMAAHVGSVESTSIHAAQGGINLLDSNGRTPAYIAADKGYVDVLRVLAEHGADLNLAGPDGITPAYVAADKGYVDVLRVLAESGADLNLAGPDGTTPAYIAAQNGHVDVLRVLAEFGADLNLAGPDGTTPAYIAAQNGHVDVLRVLAANGANVNQAGPDGTTPAMMAALNGHVDVLRVLAANGADLNQARPDGITPAFMAARDGYVDVFRVLAANGADLNQVGPGGCTAETLAARRGHTDAVKFIRSIKQRDSFLSQLDVILRRQLSEGKIKLVHALRGKITKEWGLCSNNTWAEEISTLETKIEGGRKLIPMWSTKSGARPALPDGDRRRKP